MPTETRAQRIVCNVPQMKCVFVCVCVTDDACHCSAPNASLRHKLGGTFPQGHNMYFPSPVRAKKKPPRLASHWRLHTSTAPPTPLFNVGRQRGAEAKATRPFCVGGFFFARPRRPMTTPTYAGALSCGSANSVVLAPTTLKREVARGLFFRTHWLGVGTKNG